MSKRLLLALALLLSVAAGAAAQGNPTGTISGHVVDPDGLPVPGATVTVASPALQGVRTATTSSNGDYIVPFLPAGDYEVTFELQGFQPLIRDGLQLTAGFAARVDASLMIGALSEAITVTGASPVVDVTTTRGGQTINTELLTTALPGNKTMADLVQMTPGLTNTATASTATTAIPRL